MAERVAVLMVATAAEAAVDVMGSLCYWPLLSNCSIVCFSFFKGRLFSLVLVLL